MTEPQPDDLDDIQGIVYTGYNDHPYAGFLFARLGEDPVASRAWLEALRADITPVARKRRKRPGRLNVALSATGLAALGVPDDVIDMMPAEVTAGMAARQQVLGDTAPTTWRLGGPRQRLDVLVMVYARDAETRDAELARHRRALCAADATLYPDECAGPSQLKEHFGFADGISQPFLPGLNAKPRPGENKIAAGEILMGYRNAYDYDPLSPVWDHLDLGRNGTFLVFRKLEQDVAGFWGWIAAHARRLANGHPAAAAELTELIGAKLMGRWPSGAPLTLTPDHDDPAYATADRLNAFGFLAHDPDGLRCPLSSHVRRANPRDARGGSAASSEQVVSRHRIMRRGRSYGPRLSPEDARAGKDDGVERGLYFLCLQSSVARGFEFIQQTWLANPGFLGLHGEPDPIVGSCGGRTHITIPAEPVRLRLTNVPTVVTNRGGGYFFVPSLTALARIAAGPRPVSAAARANSTA
jgi:Dyp-type peroxidase family